jgi:hypothetical protein
MKRNAINRSSGEASEQSYLRPRAERFSLANLFLILGRIVERMDGSRGPSLKSLKEMPKVKCKDCSWEATAKCQCPLGIYKKSPWA